MSDKVKAALIAGICSLLVGIIGTFGVMHNVVINNNITIPIDGKEISLTPDEYQAKYEELKADFAIMTENQGNYDLLKEEYDTLKTLSDTKKLRL
jgi:hypothetical protein